MAENDQMTDTQAATEQTAAQPMFAIEKLYVRDMSLEVPGGAEVFLQQVAPEVGVQFKTGFNQLGADAFEVQQAGIFRVAGIPEEALQAFLGSAIPNVLFPYAREAVSDASTRAGFPPVVLQPVNFDAMAQAAEQSPSEVEAPTTVQ